MDGFAARPATRARLRAAARRRHAPSRAERTLYRTGPSLFSSFGKPYGHLFDGDSDGAVTAVRFANGRALGAAKLVQSEGLVKERRAGRQLYCGYGTTVPGLKRFLPLPPTSKLKNPANTSILVWGERVFGLYEGDLPTEIAPFDLATLGEKDLGMVVESFSAHPHARLLEPRRPLVLPRRLTLKLADRRAIRAGRSGSMTSGCGSGPRSWVRRRGMGRPPSLS
jgi:Retinal pigment epithelial membrane protein